VYDAMQAETIRITGHRGDAINAYFSQPLGPGPRPGVVVVHGGHGWDEWSKEATRKLAANGYAAICPHLYHRFGPNASPDDAAAAARAAGGVSDEEFVGDAEGAIAFLRNLTNGNGKVGIIGYCSGGRQSFLAACSLTLDAAVDCYGACVVKAPPPGLVFNLEPCVHLADQLSCPLLGLFGEEDTLPGPEETRQLAAILDDLHKTYEFHTYPGAGHGFFAVDRPDYRPEAANDGWTRVFDWFDRYLSS
jgi:carboxymethylenebutenolidase